MAKKEKNKVLITIAEYTLLRVAVYDLIQRVISYNNHANQLTNGEFLIEVNNKEIQKGQRALKLGDDEFKNLFVLKEAENDSQP